MIWKFDLNGYLVGTLGWYHGTSPFRPWTYGYDIFKTSKNDLIVTGLGAHSDIGGDPTRGLGLLKFSYNLGSKWQQLYESIEKGCSITESLDGGFVIAGTLNDSIIIQKTDSLGVITKIDDSNSFKSIFRLSQNYPNPFNPQTTIKYHLNQSDYVELKIYNLLGQEVETIVEERQVMGSHSVIFDASHLSSGIYIYRLQVGSFTQTRKMILLR